MNRSKVTDEDHPLAGLFTESIPDGIDSLPAEVGSDLAELVRTAECARTAELVAAARRSLDHLPGFLRPAVRKAAGL